MKKSFTLLSLFFLASWMGLSAAEPVDPNTRTSWPSPYPLGELLISENFQDWPSTRAFSSNPLDCNMNNRTTNFTWKNMRVRRPSGESGALASIYLISAEIQPFCDTQSGTFWAIDTAVVGTSNLGPSNPMVTVGNITLLDSANTIVKDSAGVPLRRGALIIGQLPSISLIQYTTSSFGPKRGFTLEYSTDQGLTWNVIRKEHGKTVDSTKTTSGYQLANSPKGVVWEDAVELSDAMLRFTINQDQAQIVRIHDIRIFGMSALREDMNDVAFEANSQISWGEWMGVKQVATEPTRFQFQQGVLTVSGNPVRTSIYDLSGRSAATYGEERVIDLSALPKGLYLVNTKDVNGRVSTGKIVW